MGDDSFTYTVEDPDGNAATHTITVTVGPTDPVALDNDVQTDTDTAVIVSLEDLAFQPAGGSVTFTVSSAAHGTVVDNLDGTVTYTPDASYTGTDSFSYFVADASFRTASGTITVTVGPPPAPPVAGILSALEGIEDEIDNHDNDTPGALTTAFSNLEDDLQDYLNDASTLISATNVQNHATNLPFASFVQQVTQGYLAVKQQQEYLFALYQKLDAVLLANKSYIQALDTLRSIALAADTPNLTLIASLDEAGVALILIQEQGTDMMKLLANIEATTYAEMRLNYRAAATALQLTPAGAEYFLGVAPPPRAPLVVPLGRYNPLFPNP